MNETLTHWNALPAEHAAAAVLPCNGSKAWAAGLAGRRPLASAEAVLAASDAVWLALPVEDWQQAFDSHPRIGERHAKAASAHSLKWSSQEQSKALGDETAEALAEGNRSYEQKFNRIFLICATGKTAPEILASLEKRMHNDPTTELAEAAEQQRQITRLRLTRWLEGN